MDQSCSLSFSLISENRLGRGSPSHSPSSFPFSLVHVFFFLSLLETRDSVFVSPARIGLRRICVSFRVPGLLSRLPLLFSIVQSPAPLALQTLLADEARFVLNFLNFTFRGPPRERRSSPPLSFSTNPLFSSDYFEPRTRLCNRPPCRDRSSRSTKDDGQWKNRTTLGRTCTISRASHETRKPFCYFFFSLCYQLMTVIKSLGYTSRVRLYPRLQPPQ